MMCNICGCGHPETTDREHRHEADGHRPAGPDRRRLITLERDLLAHNDAHAAANRERFRRDRILALNLVSSPGAGKTTLLVRTIEALSATLPIRVVEGDQQTARDADRIRATGTPAVQINTGRACHLDAHGVGHAVDELEPPCGSLLFLENVGNLVCPAGFDLGEAHKVLILSVTEGDDKPLKYPDMFAAADLLVVNKVDLLPYVDFDMDRCLQDARRLNPDMGVLRLSARSGEGMDGWLAWLRAGLDAVCTPVATTEGA